MHYYQFNIGDYASHTRYLSQLEDLGYRRLLDLYYLSERALPVDASKVARLVGMSECFGEIEAVLLEFFTLTKEGWVNKRADEDIAKYHSKADAARSNGKKGGRPKTQEKPKRTQPVNSANPEETGSKANHKPLTINQEPINKGKQVTTAAPKFDEWDMQFSEWALSTITTGNPNFKKPNLEQWAKESRLMREIDKRDVNQMGKVWQWARADSFWHSNILSLKKFREKFDQLQAASNRPANTGYQTANEKAAERAAETTRLDTLEDLEF